MNTSTISQKLTFQELINTYKIEIPIIQRDYAQGREGEEELRGNFLDALHNSITREIPLELDFVYGDVNNNILQPLDGQQRLTTLFLLHWYIATKENISKENIKDLLLKFTYEIRISSREFCIELISKGIDFSMLLETDYYVETKSKNNQLSKTIENSHWFFLSWNDDPTIKSMLIMLDAIHQSFLAENNLWDRLKHISFQFIELKGFGLSDDLYIKMNARGKALTYFENFKAKFEQYIKQNNWEMGLDPTETFAYKIDTVWADLFWKHKGNKFSTIDYEVINFIAGIIINRYALKGNEKKVQELANTPLKVTIDDIPDKESFDVLTKSLDLYAEKVNCFDDLKINQTLLYYLSNSNSLFSEFVGDSNKGTDKAYSGPSYIKRAYFYAQTQFLLDNPIIDDSFYNWIRFVRNITENTTIDSPTTFVSAIEALQQLYPLQNNILTHLKNGDCDKIPFFGTQIAEEKIKAKLILNDDNIDWKTPIITIENHEMFKGHIGFLLNNNEYTDLKIFLKWCAKTNEFFNDTGITRRYSENSILIRALVSQFDNWELFEKLNYDSTKDNWIRIFKNSSLIPYFQKILDTNSFEDLEYMLLLNSSLSDSTQKLVHEDLYKSKLLNAIEKGSSLRNAYNNYVLYPYNARADWRKYVIGSVRNEKLAKAINENIIHTSIENQQLKVGGISIPYFWGWDIKFHYMGTQYTWDYTNKIFNTESGIESEELNKILRS